MSCRIKFLLTLGLLMCRPLGSVNAQEADKPGAAAKPVPKAQLAADAYRVFKTYCYRCHGGQKKIAGLDVLDFRRLTANHSDDSAFPAHYIVPGKLDESELWGYVDPDAPSMPKDGTREAREMTNNDRNAIRAWIEGGAPSWSRTIEKRVDAKQILAAMRDYIFQAKADDRKYLRFFTLNHLYNNANKVTELDLRLYRAALSKLLNSLSYEENIVVPQAVPGTNGTVLVIDITKLGWQKRNVWQRVLARYPYGLIYNFSRDEQLQQTAKDLTLLSGSLLPYVRADWFVFTAAQPPLYDVIMDIPPELLTLEQRLGVERERNFIAGKGALARGGFAGSGVSKQNRLVERHPYKSGRGYYWISYDFKPRKARGDLIRFPLGPVFEGNKFNDFAFSHDGGEIIFSLPNGLQAYMLILANGKRLDEPAPADVVYDDQATSGTPAIVNGLACMHCHKHGMIDFRDEIRLADAVGGFVREKVRDLYPPQAEMDKLLEVDRTQFVTALEKAVSPFLQVDEDKDRAIDEFPEPIGAVAARYLADLGPTDIALELDIASGTELQTIVKANRELRKFGLGTLLQDPAGSIKREKWETVEGSSLFQQVAVELGIAPAADIQIGGDR